MCTLIVAHRVWKEAPLVIAANRDELRGRPSAPPEIFEGARMRMFGPRDLRAGGTWLGVNARGVFVGLTNRSDGDRSGTRRSRGQLVLDALAAPDAKAAADRAPEDPDVHAGYHLVALDGGQAHRVHSDEHTVVRAELDPGVHVLTERSLGAADPSRELWVRDQMAPLADRPEPPAVDALAEILRARSSEDAPFQRTIMDVPELDYGTRASTIIFVRGRESRFLHADGPPDRTPYEDMSLDFVRFLTESRGER